MEGQPINAQIVVPAKRSECDKIAMHRRKKCYAQEFEEEPHLESAEGGITVKGQLVLNPTARAEVFAIESHEEYRVYSIDDGIA